MQNASLLLAVLALAVPGCKKDEAKDKAAPAAKTTEAPTEAPATEEPAADFDPAARVAECWKAFNEGDDKTFGSCYGPKSVVTHADAESMTGSEAILANNKMFRTAFPDVKGENDLILAHGDKVAVLSFVGGTNTGPMMMPDGSEMPATNKKHAGYGIQRFDLSDRDNVNELAFWDMGLLMGQLQGAEGVRPAMDNPGMVEETPVVSTDSDTEKANVELVKAHFASVGAKPEGESNYAPDAVFSYTGAPMDLQGLEQIGGFFGALAGAFPDMKAEINEIWGAGDYVFVHATMTGKNTGPFPPVIAKPTNKDLKMELGEIYQLKDGKITHQWVVSNGMAFAMQLDLMGK